MPWPSSLRLHPRVSFTGYRTEFIGRGGHLGRASALRQQKLAGGLGAGLDPCGVSRLSSSFEAEPRARGRLR